MTTDKLIVAISSAFPDKLDTLERRAKLITMSDEQRRAVNAAIKKRREYLASAEYLRSLARA
jgi:hypothetical protein